MRVTKRNLSEYIFFLGILVLLSVAGCGGGGGSSAGGSTSNILKTAIGDHWTISGPNTNTTSGVGVTDNISITTTNISYSGGVVTASSIVTTNGVAASSVSVTSSIEPSTGNFVLTNYFGASGKTILLPAAYAVGSSWTYLAASGVTSAIPATISAINVSRTVPAGTFNDCIKINLGPYTSSSVTLNNILYFSPTAGQVVEASYSGVATNFTYSSLLKLQAGYVAN